MTIRPKILLSEDDFNSRELVKAALYDYEVVATEWTEEAIERLEKDVFDVVITDLKMPGNGNNLIDWCRRFSDAKKVIVVSAYEFGAQWQKAMESGISVLLPKPLDVVKLREAVANIINPPKDPPEDRQAGRVLA